MVSLCPAENYEGSRTDQKPLEGQAEEGSGSDLDVVSCGPALHPKAILSTVGSVREFRGEGRPQMGWIQRHQVLSEPRSLFLCNGDTCSCLEGCLRIK